MVVPLLLSWIRRRGESPATFADCRRPYTTDQQKYADGRAVLLGSLSRRLTTDSQRRAAA
jgi:hypothetical protein